jgi:alcohol dehydrogenase
MQHSNAAAAPIEHTISFRGRYLFGPPEPSESRQLVVCDSAIQDRAATLGVIGSRATVDVAEARPTLTSRDALLARLTADGATELVGIGSGSTLDLCKRTVSALPDDGPCRLVLVPAGAEPYRAVARFAALDQPGPTRSSIQHDRHSTGTVVLLPELLESIPEETFRIALVDSLVHGIESLLSTRRQPFSEATAVDALRRLSTAPSSAGGGGRIGHVLAMFSLTEAFSSTRLGLAHALASPLGGRLRMTHDRLNATLGAAVVRFWGSAAAGFREVAQALGVAPSVDAVAAEVRARTHKAGLPACLRELGIGWDDVKSVLPAAMQSSGMPFLPRPLEFGEVERFAARAWSGG